MVAEQLREAKPARPAPVKLYSEKYKRCGKMLCIEPAEAKRALQNKVEIFNWMKQAGALLCYYEARDQGEVCTEAVSSK